uniref:Uncharacterized protein n=1 Tax=Anopheles minimus TaxID=112268 RepID=A0A182WQ58_9DIPT
MERFRELPLDIAIRPHSGPEARSIHGPDLSDRR